MANGDTAPTSDTSTQTQPDSQPATPSPKTKAKVGVTAELIGERATISVVGLEEGTRYGVEVTPPSGPLDTVHATAGENGELTAYARAYNAGDYKVVIRLEDGTEVGSASFTV